MKRSIATLATVATAGALALAAAPTDAAHGIADMTIGMNGAQEVVNPGERGASGKITLEFYGPGGSYGLDDTHHICYELTTRNVAALAPAVGMHIHEAPRGENGPVVVGLAGDAFPTTPNDEGLPCVAVEEGLFFEILDEPADYYVNYHSVETPTGAIRGQLHGFGN